MAHVDFESSYDGPPLDDNPRVHLDWVVLCQECIETAHSMLPETRDATAALREQLHAAEKERDEIGRYADSLEAAVAGRPERQPSKPRKPRYQPKDAA